MEKQTIRHDMLRRRGAYDADAARWDAVQICRRIAAHRWWAQAGCVLLYSPIRGEVDVRPLLELALAQGKTVALPRCAARRSLTLHAVTGTADEFCPGPFGIDEPRAELPQIAPHRLGLLVVPGLAFDKRGNRIGYGKGYYDRLLAVLPPNCHTVAAAYGFQLLPRISRAPHDRPLEAVATPLCWWNTQRGETNDKTDS